MSRFHYIERFAIPLGFGVIILSLCALYLPFVENPLVFDDHAILGVSSLYDYAQDPFSPYPRVFPYFTLGFLQVISEGNLAWNRHVNIVLHGSVIAALYFFLRQCTNQYVDPGSITRRNRILIFVCLWVAINPVAVYGAGYLVQRTILFATLFGLISGALYLRSQQEQRNSDVFSAALFGAFSMLSKEHSVLLPAAVVALTPFVAPWGRTGVVRALAYLALTVPCAIWVFVHRGATYVGANYEVYSGEILSQIARMGTSEIAHYPWLMSAATQALLFWKYLFLWFVPNPQWMSADMRVDFPLIWASGWAYAGVVCSLAIFITIAVIWWHPKVSPARRRWAAVFAFLVIPFVVELSAVKVQEPFVLYRSYLWMPAYALLFSLGLMTVDGLLANYRTAIPRCLLWTVLGLVLIALFLGAQNRLGSFSSEDALWRDAEQKLSRPDVAGADRIFYNLAGEAFKRKEFDEALRLSEKVVAQNPLAFQGYLAVGTSLLAKGDFKGALSAFDEASAHHPPEKFLGYIENKRCGVMAARSERDATIECLRRSEKMGYEMARFQLNMMGVTD